MTLSVSASEQQLEELRQRLREIRTARRWLCDYRVNAPPSTSAALASYYKWLCDQEDKTLEMGKRLKKELETSE